MKVAPIQATLIGSFGTDLNVVNAARVSFEKESEYFVLSAINPDGSEFRLNTLNESDRRLISYLAKHKHFSPFNHCFLSFRIKAPIFVARQLVKHKFMPWNEVSRRYVDSEPEFFYPEEWRGKADNVKQGSADGRVEEMYKVVDKGEWSEQPSHDEFVRFQIKDALASYNMMLKAGVCPEQARMILPLNTMTEWCWSGTLGAFLDMLVLRLDPHTQKESREVALLVAQDVQRLFPVSYEARINAAV